MNARVPVCIFAKPPIPGQAKTRLAPALVRWDLELRSVRPLGEAGAARLAGAFLRDVWATVNALSWARPILAGTSEAVASYGLGDDVELWLQGEGDLGARIERILSRALDLSPRALLLGADLPGLPPGHLDAALASLADTEVVLGPSDDGGFYLLGATRLEPGTLSSITWSTPSTRAQTARRLAQTGHSVREGLPFFDVDAPEDLTRLRAWLALNPRSAPHTRMALGL